jgi:outer membrane protein TolC
MNHKSLAALIAVAAWGQPSVTPAPQSKWYDRAMHPYLTPALREVSFENSTRLDNLLRDGKVQLSLNDAIALALENNLDIELERYAPAIAESDVQRALGGAAGVRGVPLAVNQLPQGIGGPASPILNLPASGVTPTTTVPTSLPELSAIVPGQASAAITGTTPFATGPPVPVLDPSIIGSLNWLHQTTPEANSFVAGTNALTGRNLTGSIGIQKGFSAGTQLGMSFNSIGQSSNSSRLQYNPYTTSNLGLTLTQPLLRGLGSGVNRRFIRIARNNQKVSSEIFRQQVIETVAGVTRLYYDLVSLVGDVEVKRQTLKLAQQLYTDNKEKVDQGTLAPIELVRAQAQVAASRQDLANSEGFELQQELILKTVLTRRGTADPAIRAARLIPTTPIDVPEREEVRPVQDLVDDAWRLRPELEEARLQLGNSQISIAGSRNSLLPEINLVGIAQNSGLGGQFVSSTQTGGAGTGLTVTPDTTFSGGFGSSLSQIFRRNYPTYGAGIELNLPIRNRVAQGDYARDLITLRQTEIRLRQLQNQVQLEVESALIASQRARAAYDASVEARKLQEQSLQIELEKYANGLSTNFPVMQYQSYVAQARSTEVAARGVYAKARTALERATGRTLENHGVVIGDALRGRVGP